MKILAIAAAAGLLAGTTAATLAASSTVKNTPGHMMQATPQKESKGASRYAPGHKMKKKGFPGAKAFAPGQQNTTTGMGTRR